MLCLLILYVRVGPHLIAQKETPCCIQRGSDNRVTGCVKISTTREETQLRGVCLEKMTGKLITILTNKEMMAEHRPAVLLDIMS